MNRRAFAQLPPSLKISFQTSYRFNQESSFLVFSFSFLERGQAVRGRRHRYHELHGQGAELHLPAGRVDGHGGPGDLRQEGQEGRAPVHPPRLQLAGGQQVRRRAQVELARGFQGIIFMV